MNNILVKIEANLAGVPEALMLNDQGYVAEGSADNIFIVRKNKLLTPPGYVGALEGKPQNPIMKLGKRKVNKMKRPLLPKNKFNLPNEGF